MNWRIKMAKMSQEEIEFGMKELFHGVLVGFILGFLIQTYWTVI